MRRILILIMIGILCFTAIAEYDFSIVSRSPTERVVVRLRPTDPEFGRGGEILETKIVYLDGDTYINRDSISTSAIVYTREVTEANEEVIKYHLLKNFNSNIILNGYEMYSYKENDIIYNIRVYDCNWSVTEDEEVTQWSLTISEKEENLIDDYTYSIEDGFSNISDFFWTGIIGLSEDTPVHLYEGSTYIQKSVYGPYNPYDVDVEIYNDDLHIFNRFGR